MLRWRWPAAKLTTCLTLTALLACAPLALCLVLWLAWQTAADLQHREQLVQQQLHDRARAVATALDAELRRSADALRLLVSSGWVDRQAGVADAARAASTETGAPPQLRTDLGAGRDLLLAGWLGLFIEGPLADPQRGAAAVSAQAVGNDRVALSVDAGHGRRLGAWIGNPHWQALLDGAGAPAGGFVTLFDGQHRIVARTPHPVLFVGQQLPADAVLALADQPDGSHGGLLLAGQEQPALAAWQRLSLAGWAVAVGQPSQPLQHAVLRAMAPGLAMAAGCLLLGLLLTVALGLLLARRLARHIATPLAALAAQATAAAETGANTGHGDALPLSLPFPDPGPLSPVLEIRALQQALASARARTTDSARVLAQRADDFETVFDASPVPLAVRLDSAGPQWRFNRAMTAFCNRHGGGQPLRKRDGRLLPPAAWPLAPHSNGGSSGSSSADMPLHEEAWHFEASGATRWLLVQATALLDGAGQLRGAVESAVDVTALKQAQQRVAEAHDKLARVQQLIDAAQRAGGIGFFQYDAAAGVFERTGGHEALFGRNGGDGRNGDNVQPAAAGLQGWLQQLAPAQAAELQAAIDALARGSGPWERVVQLPDVGAAHRHLTLRMTASGSAAGQARTVTGVVVDSSDQRQAVAARERLLAMEQQAREAAERAAADKDALLNMLGHELRNPLNALSVAAQVLKLSGTQDPLARDAQEVVERQGLELTRLVNRFLQMAGSSLAGVRTPGAADAAAGPTPAPLAAGTAPVRPRLVHLVEDNEDAAHSVQHALEIAGHDVRLSHDGVAGLAALLANPPEIAIVDLGLPGIHGTTLARQARAAGYAGQMLAVSGFDEGDSRSSALKAGFDGYMAKPLDLARLHSWIAGCA